MVTYIKLLNKNPGALSSISAPLQSAFTRKRGGLFLSPALNKVWKVLMPLKSIVVMALKIRRSQ